MSGQPLKQAGLRRSDAEMAQLHLRLRPCKCAGTHERIGIVVFVEQVEHAVARSGDGGPEGNMRSGAGRHTDAIAEREHRIEHGTHGIGQTLAIHYPNG